MTTIGTIITTHTGPARVVVMVPGGTRPDGQDYNQALTQAVASAAVPAAGAPVNAAQQSDNGQSSPSTATPAPSPVSSQPAMQAVFVLDPHAITASPFGSGSSDDQNNTDGQQTGAKDQTRSADGTTGHDGKSHWQPSGLAKITAMYRTAEKLTASEGGDAAPAATGDHLSILG